MKALFVIFLFSSFLFSKHLHKEKYYQSIFCNQHNGKIEFRLNDKTRVDCLTNEYAIEVDFATKWAEAIGQSLYYAKKTGRKAGVLLIMEKPVKDQKYLDRLNFLSSDLNITVWTISP